MTPAAGTSADSRFDEELRRSVTTPEGVSLWFRVARAGDRVGAFFLDALMIASVLVVFRLLGMLGPGDGPWLTAMMLLIVFVLRNGYFMWFELRWQGTTPGKRLFSLRVMDASGGVLRAESIVVRNLTREVEIFLPIVALSDPSVLLASGPDWLRWMAVLWLGVFLGMPLMNRERRRVGDLLGGTMVVREPRITLLQDVTEEPAPPATSLQFSPEQLAVYGVYELQVLENLLRDEPRRSKSLDLVARKIQRKIRWHTREVDAREFLTAFYRSQRARLERDLSFGQARERKDQPTP